MIKAWKKIRLILTMKCDEASHLLSDSFDRKLAWHERVALRGHLFVCTVCPALHRQLKQVQSLTKRVRQLEKESFATDLTQVPAPKLSEEARARLKSSIRAADHPSQ